ncbi:hypothetical protein FHT86_007282 [Rhizobium sp. BK313]|nr:hypothetical protein [Rhizobium sp. BK313]
MWNELSRNERDRLERGARFASGKMVAASDATALMQAVIEPRDRLCLEGNNQKQADFLASALSNVDPAVVRGLHIVQSVLALPEHLDIFETGIASRLDFSFAGPQATRLARFIRISNSLAVTS